MIIGNKFFENVAKLRYYTVIFDCNDSMMKLKAD